MLKCNVWGGGSVLVYKEIPITSGTSSEGDTRLSSDGGLGRNDCFEVGSNKKGNK